MSNNTPGPVTDWGNEVSYALSFIWRILGRVFSYVLNILLTLMLIGLITGTIVGSAFAIYIKNYIDPDISELEMLVTGQNATTKIYYMDYTDRKNRIGVPVEIESQRLFGSENRMSVEYKDFPAYLVDAFVSIEDERFWTHKGVDWKRTLGATFGFFTGTDNYGGSTITQQLIKNLTGEKEVTIQRKVQEIFRALELDKSKDKTEILEQYLNLIFLSQRCYGVQAAANKYFGKDVSDLNLIECAALAAIPQFPTRYDPIQFPENNKKRRDAVIKKMYELGHINKEEYDGAYDKELILYTPEENEEVEAEIKSWYTDEVIRESILLLQDTFEITNEAASMMIYTRGLQIYTVMDPTVQSALEEVFTEESNFPQAKGIIQPSCSMVIVDPFTGDVLGLVGDRGEKTTNRGLNYATQTKRPPGSSIKPISVYAPALEAGLISYGTVLDDTPVNFGDLKIDAATGAESYTRTDGWPQNYPAGYRGLTAINDAITRSVNTIAVKALMKLTVPKSFDFLKNKLHLDVIESREITGGRVVTDMELSPLGLGQLSYGLSVEELTAAYSIFVNKGVYNKPRTVIKILDSENNVIINNDRPGEIVISEQNASIMTKMLQGVVNNTGGTATRITLRNHIDIAGKTGTTNEDYDRWFVGFTPYYVGGVWFGYPQPKSLSAFSTSPAVLIWDTVMTKLHDKYISEAASGGDALKKFTLADGVVTKTYCKDSGKLATSACRADPRGGRLETGYFTLDNMPTEDCDIHVLVDVCRTSGGIATDSCPSTKKVGLINVTSRLFPVQVTVADAQYVAWELDGTAPGGTKDAPYFINKIPAGYYVGRSAADAQYNRVCQDHPPNSGTDDGTSPEIAANPDKPR